MDYFASACTGWPLVAISGHGFALVLGCLCLWARPSVFSGIPSVLLVGSSVEGGCPEDSLARARPSVFSGYAIQALPCCFLIWRALHLAFSYFSYLVRVYNAAAQRPLPCNPPPHTQAVRHSKCIQFFKSRVIVGGIRIPGLDAENSTAQHSTAFFKRAHGRRAAAARGRG